MAALQHERLFRSLWTEMRILILLRDWRCSLGWTWFRTSRSICTVPIAPRFFKSWGGLPPGGDVPEAAQSTRMRSHYRRLMTTRATQPIQEMPLEILRAVL